MYVSSGKVKLLLYIQDFLHPDCALLFQLATLLNITLIHLRTTRTGGSLVFCVSVPTRGGLLGKIIITICTLWSRSERAKLKRMFTTSIKV